MTDTSNPSLSNIFTSWLGYLQCWEGRCPIPRTSTNQLGRGGWKPAYKYKPGCNFFEIRTWSLKLSYKNLIGWYLAYRNINTQTYKAVIGVSLQGPPRRWALSKYLTFSMIFILTYFYKFGVRIWKAMVDLFLCILRIQFKLNTALLSHCPFVRPSQAWHLTFLIYIKA